MSVNTKAEIMEAFSRILEKKKIQNVTIKDITDECGLNRKTFYYYFSDVDDLMDETFDHEFARYAARVEQGTPVKEAITGLFRMVYEHREIIFHIYNSNGHDHMTSYVQNGLKGIFIRFIEQSTGGRIITEVNRQTVADAMTYIISGFIFDWIDSNMKEDYRELIDRAYSIVDGTMEYMLRNAEKRSRKQK